MVKAVGPELTYVRTHVRTYESEFIGSFRSLKTSGEPVRGPSNIGQKWTNVRARVTGSFGTSILKCNIKNKKNKNKRNKSTGIQYDWLPKKKQNFPFQNFPGKWCMIFSKKTIITVSIPRVRKIYNNNSFHTKSQENLQRNFKDIVQKVSKLMILA